VKLWHGNELDIYAYDKLIIIIIMQLKEG